MRKRSLRLACGCEVTSYEFVLSIHCISHIVPDDHISNHIRNQLWLHIGTDSYNHFGQIVSNNHMVIM